MPKTYNKDPLLNTISKALEIWIRSQCKSIENIDIKIESSSSEIFKGQISSVIINANKINFRNLEINKVKLKSGKILFNLFRAPKKLISRPFNLKGGISLTDRNLNQIIQNKSWIWIRNWFSDELLLKQKIYELSISSEKIKIIYKADGSGKYKEDYLSIKVSKDTLLIKNNSLLKESMLPMDPSIRIKGCQVQNKELLIDFESEVTV
tara:strand:+ start:770 stop:1393 length:624 start_codon:yes stop_codon:yes gene_type:complete